MFNKLLLTNWGFHYPFFLTFTHCLFATIFTQILSRTTNLLAGVKEGKITSNDYFYKLMPMAVLFVVGVVLGNMAYKHLSLGSYSNCLLGFVAINSFLLIKGYIQMVKAVTPVPLLILNFLAGREKPSLVQLCIVVLVSLGVILASVGELNFNLLGFMIMVIHLN